MTSGVVSLLSESYNPHVRYGAAMALGIACAGTGSKEAIALIEPMTNDPVNYVRQGALVASALVLIQHTEVTCPKVKEFRALYAKVVGDKHDDVMAKYGAILAQVRKYSLAGKFKNRMQSRCKLQNPLMHATVLLSFLTELYRARLQGGLGLVTLVSTSARYFCRALPAAFTQPGAHLLAEPCNHHFQFGSISTGHHRRRRSQLDDLAAVAHGPHQHARRRRHARLHPILVWVPN